VTEPENFAERQAKLTAGMKGLVVYVALVTAAMVVVVVVVVVVSRPIVVSC
jgi:hypothetical protein